MHVLFDMLNYVNFKFLDFKIKFYYNYLKEKYW